MRNIDRIDRICEKLAKLGKCYPDERLGQFIMNHIFNDGKDPFFKEDEHESGMKTDYETGEDILDKQIEKHKLGERVMKETSYKKDYDKYIEDDLKWIRENPLDGAVKEDKTNLGPVAPEGEDYIKDLK